MKRLPLIALCVGACVAGSAWAQGIQTGTSSKASSLGAAAEEIVETVQAAATEAKDAFMNPEAKNRCVPACYNTPNATPGCDVPPACTKIEKESGYFSNIDKACNLPAGTAIKMGQLESSCNFNAGPNRFGYTGMFQFDTNSCKQGNLKDPAVQARCMCEYTSNTRNQFKKQNGGQEPSAGMYYLFHQQGGGCATKLAFGGNQSAVAVVQQCGKVSAATALKRIACNLPGGCEANQSTAARMTAQDFANLYLSKFNGIDNTNVCAGGSLANIAGGDTSGLANIVKQQMASNPVLSTFVNAAGGPNALANMLANSGSLTSSGQPMNIFDVLKILGMEDTSSVYDDDAGKGYDTDTPTQVTKDEMAFDVTTNADGSKTVKVTHNGTERTLKVNVGMRLYVCDKTLQTVKIDSAQDTALAAKSSCGKITESIKEDVVEDATDLNDAEAVKENTAP
ncbi:MAG: hypothetical protein DI628_08350 [Blastochloris viridis]|uniref:Transglycosylase SLT domain-containing protein n=1 Tax=Blastochloris viridis TaxID=1079 RepID=A0A6N4R9Y1_BLAVI|nr:MAG: hypothetical protein DI628_08350 [Blastochloris viridis]